MTPDMLKDIPTPQELEDIEANITKVGAFLREAVTLSSAIRLEAGNRVNAYMKGIRSACRRSYGGPIPSNELPQGQDGPLPPEVGV